MLHHSIYGSYVTWRTRKVTPGDDDHPAGRRAFCGRDRISLRATATANAERGRHPPTSWDKELRKEGENHENAEARRSSVWASVAATVATDRATTNAVSATSTSILPTLRLGRHRIERTMGRRRYWYTDIANYTDTANAATATAHGGAPRPGSLRACGRWSPLSLVGRRPPPSPL